MKNTEGINQIFIEIWAMKLKDVDGLRIETTEVKQNRPTELPLITWIGKGTSKMKKEK